jgi:Peptidase C13 family
LSDEFAPTADSTLPQDGPRAVTSPASLRLDTSAKPATGLQWLRQAWRAATGRPLGELPCSVGRSALSLALLAHVAMALASERAMFTGEAEFSLSGWLYGLAPWPFILLLVWLAMPGRSSPTRHIMPTAAWVTLYALASIPLMVVAGVWSGLWMHKQLPAWLMTEHASWSAFGVLTAWLGLFVWRISQRLQAHRGWVAFTVVALMALQSVETLWLNSSSWQATLSPEGEDRPRLMLSQEVFEAQEALLGKALAGLSVDSTAPIQVYGLVYAPYAQDVFLRESAMVEGVMQQRLGAKGRVVKLVNHASATQDTPWATPRNLQKAVQAIGQTMRREQDVLLLYITSHGGADHRVASSHWPLEVEDLTATQVRQWLDEAGIRHRAIAVSACYSGGWVEPLRGDGTLVMTAADADHTSYGCGSKSDLTFFGKAVFDEALRRTTSLEEAFAQAVPVIRQREIDAGKDDGFSNPQLAAGAAFKTHWAQWVATSRR